MADYVEIIRQQHPQVPATQPLGVPVDLRDAGHYRLATAVHLDLRGDLWFVHPDAPPLEQTIRSPKVHEEQAHVVPREVAFAVWAAGEKGRWFPRVVVREDEAVASTKPSTNASTAPAASSTDAGRLAWYWQDQRHDLPADRGYRWADALLLGDGGVAVPTDRGVSVFTFDPQYAEAYHEILHASAPADANPPQLLLDARGVLAWTPWERGKTGGDGAARLVDGKWTRLGPSEQWPRRIVHLVPLLDGSVLQLYRGESEAEGVKLAMATLDLPAVDEKAIVALVEQLSADEAAARDKAHAELTRYGTASWPVLEKLMDRQPPEARIRIGNLLRDRMQPTLGGRLPIDGRVEVVSRIDGGGALLYLPGGVSIPREDNPSAPPTIVQPAWISIRPGRAIEMLEPVLTAEADPARHRFFAFGDEWLISDTEQGPRRLYGNHLEPMLRKNEAAFAHVVGFDRRGRWIFRRSANDTGATLLVDPTLPDPTPKLPVWLMSIDKGSVGWNVEDYPAVNRGGKRHSWVLAETGWRPLDEAKDRLITEKEPDKPRPPADDVSTGASPATAPATTRAATTQMATTRLAATSRAATTQAATSQAALGPPLLVDPDGRSYHDGRETLTVLDRAGKLIVWPLPAKAAGEADFGEPVLLRTADGTLFLFNGYGRVVRIKPTPEGDEPFIVEAVFTHRIPQPDTIHRIWLDPAGRIAMTYDKVKLAIMFPGGRIPGQIATMIPARELSDEE